MISTISLITRLILTVLIVTTLQSRPHDFVVAQSQTEERPAGLLALPEVFGEYPCTLFQEKKLDVYGAPAKDRPPIGVIERLNPLRPPERPDCDEPQVAVRGEPLPMDETGEGFLKAVVFEKNGRWFRIAMPHGSAWIERPDSDGFMSYPEDLAGESYNTYLREGWDGNVWSIPGAAASTPAPIAWRAHGKEEIPVRVIGSQVVRGEKWVHIRFQSESCGQSFGNLPALEDWLPAYRPSKATTVWFYSRGC